MPEGWTACRQVIGGAHKAGKLEFSTFFVLPPFHVARGSRLGRSHASAMPNPRPPPLPLAVTINGFLWMQRCRVCSVRHRNSMHILAEQPL